MAQQESQSPSNDVLSGFQVTVQLPGHGDHEARVLDIGFRTICVALRDCDIREPVRGAVQVHLRSPDIGNGMEAVARVQNLITDQGDTVLRLEVVDWIGLREQLPPHLRQLLCLREAQRYFFPADQRPLVDCKMSGMGAEMPLVDLSINGMSFVIPRDWAEKVEKGDRVDTVLVLPGTDHVLLLVGFVRHVTFESDHVLVGMLFDANLTSEYLQIQLRLMRFMDDRGQAD